MEISLEGKVALVTGVGPNIGSGIALALSQYGAKVACNDVNEAAIKACIARIERNGGEAMAAPGDVTDEAAVSSSTPLPPSSAALFTRMSIWPHRSSTVPM